MVTLDEHLKRAGLGNVLDQAGKCQSPQRPETRDGKLLYAYTNALTVILYFI